MHLGISEIAQFLITKSHHMRLAYKVFKYTNKQYVLVDLICSATAQSAPKCKKYTEIL